MFKQNIEATQCRKLFPPPKKEYSRELFDSTATLLLLFYFSKCKGIAIKATTYKILSCSVQRTEGMHPYNFLVKMSYIGNHAHRSQQQDLDLPIQDQISSIPFPTGNFELNSHQNSRTVYFEGLMSHHQGWAFFIWFQGRGTNIKTKEGGNVKFL